MLLSYKPLDLETQQRLQEEGCVVDINDYLANYMTGVEATKVNVYNSCYHDNALEVFLKAVKDERAIVTRGWTKVVRAYGM